MSRLSRLCEKWFSSSQGSPDWDPVRVELSFAMPPSSSISQTADGLHLLEVPGGDVCPADRSCVAGHLRIALERDCRHRQGPTRPGKIQPICIGNRCHQKSSRRTVGQPGREAGRRTFWCSDSSWVEPSCLQIQDRNVAETQILRFHLCQRRAGFELFSPENEYRRLVSRFEEAVDYCERLCPEQRLITLAYGLYEHC